MAAIRRAGGPYGRGSHRQTWNGATVKVTIQQATQKALEDLAKEIRATLQEELHRVSGEMAEKSFATVDVRGTKRTLRAGSDADHTAYHEVGTVNFEGHPQIRKIMDRYAPQVTQRIKANMP